MKISERYSYVARVFLGENGEVYKEIEEYFEDDDEAREWIEEEAANHPAAVGYEIRLMDWLMHQDTEIESEWYDEWYSGIWYSDA